MVTDVGERASSSDRIPTAKGRPRRVVDVRSTDHRHYTTGPRSGLRVRLHLSKGSVVGSSVREIDV